MKNRQLSEVPSGAFLEKTLKLMAQVTRELSYGDWVKRMLPIIVLLLVCGGFFIVIHPFNSSQASVLTNVSGLIDSDTIWTLAESPYNVNGDVTVDQGVTLTIEPGVDIMFNGVFAIIVKGTLDAHGTEASPITFTINPAIDEYWGMLDFRAESLFNALEYTIIEHGGNQIRWGLNCASGAVCVSTSSIYLNESTIQNNATRGLVLRQSDAVISNNTFENHENEAIRLDICDHNIGPCRPAIIGNRFTGNDYAILRYGSQDPYISGNQASNNRINGLVLATPCSFASRNTWYGGDLPYVVESGHCNVEATALTTLTIQPGAVIKFGSNAGMEIWSGNIMTATGTIEQPIVFTSLKDDGFGGDSNNDGSTSSPAKEDWDRIYIAGSGTRATLEHSIFRYGGSSSIEWGSLLDVDYTADVTISNSEFSDAEVGVKFGRGASGGINDTIIRDMETAGVYLNTDGQVIISNTRFEDTGIGVQVDQGEPVVGDSFFQGNDTAVKVTCSPWIPVCAPVISPHNRFVGGEQQGILNLWPKDICVQARYNWWGDETGPLDTTADQDACGLVDNPGSGASSSDGVDYSPWEGGVARPIIARPGCGVTALPQPTFVGRSQAGATLSFYDGEALMGQTTAASDHSFSWTPAVLMMDGDHTITAIATFGEESSLPSSEIPLTVDSTLPFDPAGVLISYDYHTMVYTQTLKDSSGCASITGDLSTPVSVREDAQMTITIPINTDLVPGVTSTNDSITSSQASQPSIEFTNPTAVQATITISNTSLYDVSHMRIANLEGERVFSPYGPDIELEILRPGEVRSVSLPDGIYDIVYYSGDTRIVDRSTVSVFIWDQDITISKNNLALLSIDNQTGRDIIAFYLAEIDASQDPPNYFGGSFLSNNNMLKNGSVLTQEVPDGIYDVILYDSQGTFYTRQIFMIPFGSPFLGIPSETVLDLYTTNPGVNFKIENGGDKWICAVRMSRYPDYELFFTKPIRAPVNFLQYLGFGAGIIPGDTIEFKVEPGLYYLQAVDCDGKVVDERYPVEISGDSFEWKPVKRCDTYGNVKIGNTEKAIVCPQNQLYSTDGGFVNCTASGPVSSGPMMINVCVNGSLKQTQVGTILIDPDGYVYDASIGLEGKIQGATVTCDVYDEDYQSWERWPAELYESQINPQVTDADGYYAFFVPPGLYRVRAVAAGYDDHTSPDIQVINEVVHYNVPLIGGGGLFLPFVVR